MNREEWLRRYYQLPHVRARRKAIQREYARRRRADPKIREHINHLSKLWRQTERGRLAVIRRNLGLPTEAPKEFLKMYWTFQQLKKELRKT